MKHYNKKIEIIRIFKHYILEWEDKDAEAENDRQYGFASATGRIGLTTPSSGTEVYDSKDDLIARIEKLL